MLKPAERPLEQLLELMGHKGVFVILHSLQSGPLRFGALQQLTDLPPRTLSLRLKELEELRLIGRTEYNEVPPRVDYALTERGQSLRLALEALVAWEEKSLR
ncbi:MAG: transcriptional regulator [Meiothermus sp.]